MNTIILVIVVLVEKPIHSDYSALTEDIESIHKSFKFQDKDRVRITKYKNIFRRIFWSKEIFVIDSVLKTNHWTYNIKDLNEEKS